MSVPVLTHNTEANRQSPSNISFHMVVSSSSVTHRILLSSLFVYLGLSDYIILCFNEKSHQKITR